MDNTPTTPSDMDADSPLTGLTGFDAANFPAEATTKSTPQSPADEDTDSGYFTKSDTAVEVAWSPDSWKGFNTENFPPAASSDTETDTYANGNTEDFGDFADSDNDIDVEESSEPWENYDTSTTTHVFYPIYVGEILNERYRVEHKIGYGASSTVWMAYDLQDEIDVALKVMCAGKWGDHEIRIQDEIIRHVQDTSHLVTYLATFLLPRDGGDHRILVLPLVGQCVVPHILKKASMATRMSAAHQLLKTLESLHKAGIVHRGR